MFPFSHCRDSHKWQKGLRCLSGWAWTVAERVGMIRNSHNPTATITICYYLEVLVKLGSPRLLDAVARPQHLLRHRGTGEHHGVGRVRLRRVLDLQKGRKSKLNKAQVTGQCFVDTKINRSNICYCLKLSRGFGIASSRDNLCTATEFTEYS